jgi:hypothetical protein
MKFKKLSDRQGTLLAGVFLLAMGAASALYGQYWWVMLGFWYLAMGWDCYKHFLKGLVESPKQWHGRWLLPLDVIQVVSLIIAGAVV